MMRFDNNITFALWIKVLDFIKYSDEVENIISFNLFSLQLTSNRSILLNYNNRSLISQDYNNLVARWNMILLTINLNNITIYLNNTYNPISIIFPYKNSSLNTNLNFGNRLIYLIKSLLITTQWFPNINMFLSSFFAK